MDNLYLVSMQSSDGYCQSDVKTMHSHCIFSHVININIIIIIIMNECD